MNCVKLNLVGKISKEIIYFFSLNSVMLIQPAIPTNLVSQYVTLYFRMTLETYWKTKIS